MPLLNSIVTWVMKQRMHQIELFMKYPHEVQNDVLAKLLNTAKDTEWGKNHNYGGIQTLQEFRERVPVQDYDDVKPYIERLQKGEKNILWPGEIKWFAKSSGTTSDKSKFIPVSAESLEECHFKGGKDMLSMYCNNIEDTQLFTGKNLALGGSHQSMTQGDNDFSIGDLSAIIIQNLPFLAEAVRTPSLDIALMNEWEAKIDKLAEATMQQNVTSMAGVPSWLLLLIKYMLNKSGKTHLNEIWPNLEVYFHGGINFAPYREQFKALIPSGGMHYMETYNASEGFFGIQHDLNNNEMLLMLDYGIYYEFIPVQDNLETNAEETLSLDEVELDKNYAILISTNGGLWRYKIGDTVKFTSLHPYKIQITGRTKHFINAFGEEVIIDNAEKALAIACEKTRAVIKDYTAAPVYFSEKQSGAHEWLIEFETEPQQLDYFTEVLDNALKSINSDYEAKRYKDMILKMPLVKKAKSGAFYEWLRSKNKLGGQHKVPRLANDRKIMEEIKTSAGIA